MNENSQLLLSAFRKNFKTKETEVGMLRLPHGAQFSNRGGIVGFFLAIFLLVISISLMVQSSFLLGFVFLLFCLPIIAFVADLRGIEIDLKKEKIRSYRSFWGYRYGTWLDLKGFTTLVIQQDSTLEKRAIPKGHTYADSRAFDTHFHYTLSLADENKRIILKVWEEENIHRIKQLAHSFSQDSQLPLQQDIKRNKAVVIGRWRMF